VEIEKNRDERKEESRGVRKKKTEEMEIRR
jgi:hypothetical protein